MQDRDAVTSGVYPMLVTGLHPEWCTVHYFIYYLEAETCDLPDARSGRGDQCRVYPDARSGLHP
jgi:hypothetical protein